MLKASTYKGGSNTTVDLTSDPTMTVPLTVMVSLDGVVMTPSAVFSNTGECFNIGSLKAEYTWADGKIATVTRGPNERNKKVRKTYTWVNGVLMAESDWVVV